MAGAPAGRRASDRRGGGRAAGRPRDPSAALGLLAVLGAALAAVETTAADAALWVGPALLAAGSWVTAVVVARRGGRLSGRSARPWRALSLTAALLGLGQAASALAGVGVNTSEAGWHDLPLLAAVPVAIVAGARLLPAAGDRLVGSRALLDGGIVLVAVSLLGEALLVDVATRSGDEVDALVAVGYPAVGALLCGLGLVAVSVVDDARRRAAGWLLAACGALAVVVVSGALAISAHDTGLDVLTGVAWLAMLAAVMRSVDVDPGRDREDDDPPAGLPLAPVVFSTCAAFGVALFLAVGVTAGRTVSPLEGAGITVLMLLTFVRCLLWAADGERLTRRVRRTEGWLRALLDSGEAVTVLLDRAGRVVWATGPVRDQLGWTHRDLSGRVLLALVHAGDREFLARVAIAVRAGEQPAELPATVRLGTADGDWRTVEVSGAARTGDDGGLVLHLRDVTARTSSQRELERLAYTDFLTGLPNRARFIAALRTGLAGPDPGCLLLVDLDGFKAVNDVAGHDAGDRLLCEVADRLRAAARDGDVVARLGGDEFAVLVHGGREEATTLAERLVVLLDRDHRPLTPAGSPDGGPVFRVSGSVGVTALRPGEEPAEAVRRADVALRAAKAAGKNCVRSSGAALDRVVDRRARLARDLPAAIAGGQLSVVYQPVVGVPERRVLGLEALVRWDHPELGAVPPEEFVPLAEDDGLVVPLQRWVLAEATATLAPLLAAGHDLQLGVNVSIRHLQSGCLAADVATALAGSGVPPHRLMLELTESVLMGAGERMDGDLATLRDLGCVLSLDDFGKGHSSLARLARLPVQVLKMDRAFVAHIEADPRTAALVDSVVQLGRTLGMDVVAEGVETTGQLAALRSLGCRYLQGFLLGRPVAAGQLPAMLARFDPAVLDAVEVSSHV
ncbi:putative bifunctional diguanylate cyclase/phosphodiesterase [Geodermatophilus sabuli]|uniref:PAS domain S-box-containing protein/diguanylate cyclase (GGDEF) domain-containing protein n=1 Tax=Geodermatophilus sabuli TaxID=1564158 RepID=A0A285EIF4_9ACTN|nr:GGDEF domain-containing phosphodiesterase [Geodermatophilus sabuli]MBB3085871.1 diguanylate cyclase (GGDEF)-like protein/PAS domain S-box-containing protein [Geodermatophilus sabuli]SNX98918.1 PAS domain S-box-containing protein/diguanylate cyclase (GGDEF) domain-containing protein [Geodermatophilus sabuli]